MEQENKQPIVMVIDDDELARSVIVGMLEIKGYSVLEASSPLDALTLLRSRQEVDLLITDLHMPGDINGAQFVKMARSLRPELKVLYATGYADQIMDDIQDDPQTQLLAKPFQLNAFLGKVSSMMHA